MANYGVTAAGFVRKPYNVILNENEERARDLFGEDMDLSINSPVGLFVQLLSWQSSLIWQEMENTYYANWLDTAEGVNLEKIVALGGLVRKTPRKAVIQDQVFYGDQGTEIPMGFQVETAGGVRFETTDFGTIDSSGELTLPCMATVAGPTGAVAANSVTEIVSPLTGLNSTANISGSAGAKDYETDDELRYRYRIEGVEGAGSSTDSIRMAILNVKDVLDAVVYENITIDVDGEGRPPKSIECIVLGGDKQAIGEAIFETKPAGIETYGSEKATISFQSFAYDVYFNWISSRYIHVDIVVSATPEWNTSNETDIMTNTISYIGGIDTREVDGTPVSTNYYGIPPGDNVYPWRIAAANRDVSGIEDIAIGIGFEDEIHGYQEISTDPPGFAAADIPGLSGTYQLKVTVDGGTETAVNIEIISTDNWSEIAGKINTGLSGAGLPAFSALVNNSIRISSSGMGTASAILMAEGDTNGLIAAIDAVTGTPSTLETPVPGVDLISGKLSVGIRELARCENDNITITVNMV